MINNCYLYFIRVYGDLVFYIHISGDRISQQMILNASSSRRDSAAVGEYIPTTSSANTESMPLNPARFAPVHIKYWVLYTYIGIYVYGTLR